MTNINIQTEEPVDFLNCSKSIIVMQMDELIKSYLHPFINEQFPELDLESDKWMKQLTFNTGILKHNIEEVDTSYCLIRYMHTIPLWLATAMDNPDETELLGIIAFNLDLTKEEEIELSFYIGSASSLLTAEINKKSDMFRTLFKHREEFNTALLTKHFVAFNPIVIEDNVSEETTLETAEEPKEENNI